MEISDVYWNHKMIEHVNGHWEFNLRDHAFTFPGIWETFQRHIEPSFAFDVIIGHELQPLQGTVCHVLSWQIGMHQWGFSTVLCQVRTPKGCHRPSGGTSLKGSS